MVATADFWFVTGRVPMAKTFSHEGVSAYPQLKRLTSSVQNITLDKEGLRQLHDQLKRYAGHGSALLQGPLSRKIENESRRGLGMPEAPRHFLVLDVDSLDVGLSLAPPFTQATVIDAAEAVIAFLPPAFHDTSYVAHASSSFGIKTSPNEVSLHLVFFLYQPMLVQAAKNLLTGLNIVIPQIRDSLGLSPSGTSIKFKLDPVLANNSHLLFIAPPNVIDDGRYTDPFSFPDQRFALVEKDKTLLDVREIVPSPSMVQKERQKLFKQLRNLAGLPDHNVKLQRTRVDDKDIDVVTNPDRVEIEFANESEDFVRYNLNGGDSNAYWVWKYNPAVMFSFKGDELPFSFQAANPEMYQWHCQEFLGRDSEGSKDIPPIPMVFIDYPTSTTYKMLVDPKRLVYVGENDPVPTHQMHILKAHMAEHGATFPDPMESWEVVFRPGDNRVVNLQDRWVNTYVTPDVIADPQNIPVELMGITYGDSRDLICQYFPTVFKIMWSMLGSDAAAFEHFMNWFSWIVQHRDKTQTAWLLHGVQGTGKGRFLENIAKPILATREDHVKEIQLAQLEDAFNSWVRDNILLAVDEFKAADAISNASRIENTLKHLITERTMTVRQMRTDARSIRTYNNVMVFSNNYDMLRIDENDRRWNVAPPQEIPLIKRHENIWDEIQRQLPGEIAAFAATCVAFDCDERAVHTPLANAAKEAVKVASRTTEEDFFVELFAGNLEYFLTILDRENVGYGQDFLLPAQNIVRGILAHYQPDTYYELTTEEISTLYRAVFPRGKDMSAQIFGKKLSRRGRAPTPLAGKNNRRGIRVMWVFPTWGSPDTPRKLYLSEADHKIAKLATQGR